MPGQQARLSPITSGFGDVAGPLASTPRRTAVVARSMSWKRFVVGCQPVHQQQPTNQASIAHNKQTKHDLRHPMGIEIITTVLNTLHSTDIFVTSPNY